MGKELETRLPPPDMRVTRRMLKAVNAYLFEEGGCGFRGANAGEAASPDASCLDQVMDRKMGLPIMLSLVYLELTRRVGFPMIGVNLPAHFMIRPLVEGSELLVDPFRMGELIDVETAEERLAALYGKARAGARTHTAASVRRQKTPVSFCTPPRGPRLQVSAHRESPARAAAIFPGQFRPDFSPFSTLADTHTPKHSGCQGKDRPGLLRGQRPQAADVPHPGSHEPETGALVAGHTDVVEDVQSQWYDSAALRGGRAISPRGTCAGADPSCLCAGLLFVEVSGRPAVRRSSDDGAHWRSEG